METSYLNDIPNQASQRNRKHITLDDYVTAGAYARLLKTLLTDSLPAFSKVSMSIKDSDKLIKIHHNLASAVDFENCLQNDFPSLATEEFRDVFYGDVGVEYCPKESSAMEAEIRDKVYKISSNYQTFQFTHP